MTDSALQSLRALDERRRHLAGSRNPRLAHANRVDGVAHIALERVSRKRANVRDDAESGDVASQASRKRQRTTPQVGSMSSRSAAGGRRGSGGSNNQNKRETARNLKNAKAHQKQAASAEKDDDRPFATSLPAVVQGRNRRMFGALLGHLRSAKASVDSDQDARKTQNTRMDEVTRRHNEEGNRLREMEVRRGYC
jgi:hypothetical protein